MKPRALTFAAALLACAGMAGCGDSTSPNRIRGTRLTIYASVPLEGASRIDGEAVLNGARLALSEVDGHVGKYQITFAALDDATVKTGGWDPGQTETAARLAVADRTTIGYIGEFNSGASAVSIPLLNRAGIAQISPASTAVGLTSAGPGSSPGEPLKYYPTGQRTFARVVPNDAVQAAVQVKLQQSLGCTKTFVVDDGEFDGADTATTFAQEATTAGLRVAGVEAFQRNAADYTAFAAGVASTGADCILVSSLIGSGAALVTRQLAAALPHARIFGVASLADSAFTDPALGGIPVSLDRRVLLTAVTLDPDAYPPAGRAFFERYTIEFGVPEPYAIFGYEAMSLMLHAIARASDDGKHPVLRSRVVAALFATRNRQSVLGSYGIDKDGDTTLARFGVWRVVAGQPVFWKAMTG